MTTDLKQTDRIRLPFSYDVEKMMNEVNKMNIAKFTYYNVIPLRSPAHIVNPSIPFPPPADDYADGSWTDWLNTQELEQSPYLKSIVEEFQQHTDVTLVRLLRLEKGNVVDEHSDPTLGLQIDKSVIRLTIPIQKLKGADFYLNSEIVPMKQGECWYLRLTDTHKIINNSDADRINLTIDMIPNDWVRDTIQNAFDV